jgi:hypothetical protein
MGLSGEVLSCVSLKFDRYSWVPDEALGDCPEKRFIFAIVIQSIHDAVAFGRVPEESKLKDSYVENMDLLAQFITSKQFFWWMECLGFDAIQMSSIILDVIRGRWYIDPRVLKKGCYNIEFADRGKKCGFASQIETNPARQKELSALGYKVRRSKRNETKKSTG